MPLTWAPLSSPRRGRRTSAAGLDERGAVDVRATHLVLPALANVVSSSACGGRPTQRFDRVPDLEVHVVGPKLADRDGR